MPKGTAQVIFECPESFRRRLYEEKLKRRMSIKRLIMEAVEEQWFYAVEEQRFSAEEQRFSADKGEILVLTPDPEADEREHWGEMFVEYMERCPPQKVQLLQSVIKEDLKIYKSRRAGRKRNKSAAAEKGKRLPAKNRSTGERMAKEKQ
jgi:hypothetical protein